MTTTVVNVKVENIRPEYQNLKEWMNDENNVYIGRGGIVFIDGERFPKQNSEWANPFKISKDTSQALTLSLFVLRCNTNTSRLSWRIAVRFAKLLPEENVWKNIQNT